MNIILDKSLITDSKQPKVFELGQITTTLQDLLDSSKIVINGNQTIILSIIDISNNNLKYLLPLDYQGESFYGLGKNILESDLIPISNGRNYDSSLLNCIISQSGTDSPVLNILSNSFNDEITTEYVSVGTYYIDKINTFDRYKTQIFLESYITPTLTKVDIYKTITLSGRILIQVFANDVLSNGYLVNSSLKIETF